MTEPFTIHAIAPHCVNWASVSMSLVTRATSAPRRRSVWSAIDSRWMWAKVRTRRLRSRLSSAARTSRRYVARLMSEQRRAMTTTATAQAG